ncbi:MAG: HIT domain-containing protein [candidate division NC10 bacterium]|nr:HIT domain-containing protein [candidate division NC10 bacterium]
MTLTLWAPWRMAYINGPRPEGCFFCEIAKGDADRENLVLHRGPLTYVVMNRYPYNNGHVMVVPYTHSGNLDDFSDEESLAIMRDAQRVTRILHEAFRTEGFNLGFNLGRLAGAGVAEHVHLHVVPRWAGDTNFMPVLADIKVMPEYLEATYDRLVPYFHEAGR